MSLFVAYIAKPPTKPPRGCCGGCCGGCCYTTTGAGLLLLGGCCCGAAAMGTSEAKRGGRAATRERGTGANVPKSPIISINN